MVAFALLGALVFGVDRLRHPPTMAQDDIVISADFVRGVRGDLTARGGRPPTGPELDAALARFSDEEVLYREALALGLDRGDPIVRRRLVQKLELMLQGESPEPDDATLQRHLDAHPERFRTAASVSFEHVFVDAGRHPDLDADCAALAPRLAAGEDPARLGDAFIDGTTFNALPLDRLRDRFGEDFARALADRPATASWSGPIRSRFGCHLVRVRAISPSSVPSLADVRGRVRGDWIEARRAESLREAILRLRARHPVRIEAAP